MGWRKQSLPSVVCAIAAVLLASAVANAEDGYRLWLRYDPLPASVIADYRSQIKSFVVEVKTPALEVVSQELSDGLSGLLGKSVSRADKIDQDGAVVVLTTDSRSSAFLILRRKASVDCIVAP